MIGDSLTWQMYNSLACLLAPVTAEGFSTTWDKANTTVTKEYKGREWPEDRHILKQYWCAPHNVHITCMIHVTGISLETSELTLALCGHAVTKQRSASSNAFLL